MKKTLTLVFATLATAAFLTAQEDSKGKAGWTRRKGKRLSSNAAPAITPIRTKRKWALHSRVYTKRKSEQRQETDRREHQSDHQ